MKQTIILFQFILFTCFVYGQDIRVGVYRANTIQQIEFAHNEGDYYIYGDTSNLGVITSNEFVSIVREGRKVRLSKGVVSIGVYDTVFLRPIAENSAIRLRPIRPKLREKRYRDHFIVFASTNGLSLVNDASFSNYLGGVIESEGGGGKHVEYYKAQAVISRTYALRHFNRHRKDGFNLCDQVHCQVYHNMLIYTPDIDVAVKATDGVYMVYTITNSLVESYFHANCGGETSSSDYVWREDIPYLQPFKDTFCIYTRQATWEKRVSKIEWRNFLINNYFYPIKDSLYKSLIYTFDQDTRKAFYITPALGIPLRDIRYHFKLRSTFFSCYPDGNDVVIKGRGFGHGVGLCQEGAMNMAKNGIPYRHILSYYYSGVIFKNHYEELFFNQSSDEDGSF